MSPTEGEREGRRYLDAIDQGAGRVVRYHPRVGLIYTYCDWDRQWWVQGGNTRIAAMDRSGAESLAEEWDRTGDCPVPRRFRITPRTKRSA